MIRFRRSKKTAERSTSARHADRLARLQGRPYQLTTDGWEEAPSFGFDFLADAIANVIIRSEPQLTLAVYGRWGIGKTTLLHAIDERISEKCTVVWFDMWEYKNQEHVIPHLLDAIADALPQESQAAKGLRTLARAALASASLSAGNVSFSGKDLLGELDRVWAAPKVETQQLNSLIQHWRGRTDQRIVVMVDNLDRCLPEQAVALLEQITSLFGFPGVVFVLAAERDRLAQAIEAKNGLQLGEGLVYLEKIIQVEFRVPGLDQDHVLRWIGSLIRPPLQITGEDAQLLAEVAAWNPRLIKRLLNNVRIQLCTARHEVAGDVDVTLASALLLHHDQDVWLSLTASEANRKAAISSGGPDELIKSELVARIVHSSGGRRFLEMNDQEMKHFLTSAESTLGSGLGDSKVEASIEEARMSTQLRCDLYLEGAGINVLALAGAVNVLEERGYVFQNIACASFGAFIGPLLAVGYTAAASRDTLRTTDFSRFLRRPGRSSSPIFGFKPPFPLSNLREWMDSFLTHKNVSTFSDLRAEDPINHLPEKTYRLVVIAADPNRDDLVNLPWDCHRYGVDPDRMFVADAAVAAMAIPNVFEPFRLRHPDGGTSLLTDGGTTGDYPLAILDRSDFSPPRWPTLGILALGPERAETQPQLSAQDAARTINIPHSGLRSTDFLLTPEQGDTLYEAGRTAAERFLASWDFDKYRKAFRANPSTP
jgi:NTE family protein